MQNFRKTNPPFLQGTFNDTKCDSKHIQAGGGISHWCSPSAKQANTGKHENHNLVNFALKFFLYH